MNHEIKDFFKKNSKIKHFSIENNKIFINYEEISGPLHYFYTLSSVGEYLSMPGRDFMYGYKKNHAVQMRKKLFRHIVGERPAVFMKMKLKPVYVYKAIIGIMFMATSMELKKEVVSLEGISE